jgi:hypothetical protein
VYKKIFLGVIVLILVLVCWIWFKNSGYWYFNYYILHQGPPPSYCDPGPCNTKALSVGVIKKIEDLPNLYSVEIPKDWKVTESIGTRGVSLSSIHTESPDWKSHSVAGEMEDSIYYDTGAYFSIGVTTLINEDPFKYTGAQNNLINKKNVVIGGINATQYLYKDPNLVEGQILGASLIYKGDRYSFQLGYNPKTYPNGETVFINMLNSVKFIK